MALAEDLTTNRWRLRSGVVPRILEQPWWSPTIRTEPWKPFAWIVVILGLATLVSMPLTIFTVLFVAVGTLVIRLKARNDIARLPESSSLTLDHVGLHSEDDGLRWTVPRSRVTHWWWYHHLLMVRFRHLQNTYALDTSSVDRSDLARIDHLMRNPVPTTANPGDFVASWHPTVRADTRRRKALRQARGESPLVRFVPPALFLVLSAVLLTAKSTATDMLVYVDPSTVVTVVVLASVFLGRRPRMWLWHQRTGPNQLRLGPDGLTVVEAGGSKVTTFAWSGIGRLECDDAYLFVNWTLDSPSLRVIPLVALPDGTVDQIRSAVLEAREGDGGTSLST
jgi:hypothetical protein